MFVSFFDYNMFLYIDGGRKLKDFIVLGMFWLVVVLQFQVHVWLNLNV